MALIRAKNLRLPKNLDFVVGRSSGYCFGSHLARAVIILFPLFLSLSAYDTLVLLSKDTRMNVMKK